MKNGFLTALLCLLLIVFVPMNVATNHLSPLIFGFSFCLVNRKLLKFAFLTGIIYSVLLSYVAFFIGFFALLGIGFIGDQIVEILQFKSIDGTVYILISGMIAQLSIYFFYTKIYRIKNLRNGFYVILLSYIFVPILVYAIPIIFKNILITEFFGIYNLSWLLIVSLFLSFTLENNKTETKKIIIE